MNCCGCGYDPDLDGFAQEFIGQLRKLIDWHRGARDSAARIRAESRAVVVARCTPDAGSEDGGGLPVDPDGVLDNGRRDNGRRDSDRRTVQFLRRAVLGHGSARCISEASPGDWGGKRLPARGGLPRHGHD